MSNSSQNISSKVRKIKVFLCHGSEDKSRVRELYQQLSQDGFQPWLDEEDILPGQEWEQEIPQAVRRSDVVIVFLSKLAIVKTGYVQKEIKFALDVADNQPEGSIFIIPARLEECLVPQRLSRWQWVNLFQPDGYSRLVQALQQQRELLDAGIETRVHHTHNDQRSNNLVIPSRNTWRSRVLIVMTAITVMLFIFMLAFGRDGLLKPLVSTPEVSQSGINPTSQITLFNSPETSSTSQTISQKPPEIPMPQVKRCQTPSLAQGSHGSYDKQNRLIAVTDANGHSKSYAYDFVGNVVLVTDALGFTVSCTYDSENRIVQYTDAIGAVWAYNYDPNGNIVSTTDANGYTTRYGYDVLGRIVKMETPNNLVTRYDYDSAGRITKIIDPEGNQITYTYDKKGDVLEVQITPPQNR